MSDPAIPLHIATSDPELAHAWLRNAYVDHSANLSGRRDAFRFTHRVADCGPFKVGVASHTMRLQGEWDRLDDMLLFSHLVSGRFTIRSNATGGAEVAAGPGDVFSYDPDASMTVDWNDIRMAQIRLDRAAVDRVATELFGDDRVTAPVGFELSRPVSAAQALHWKRLMRYVSGDVAANPAVQDNPLVLRQVFRLVVATALETFPNTAVDPGHRRAGRASPASVRRAVAFIEERAGEDVDLTAIAAAAHVGPRALQRSFRQALDTTPLGYLRWVRLGRAHEDLRAADPATTTVMAVAARWGFGHPGRFAADYRRRFGVSPSDTLRG